MEVILQSDFPALGYTGDRVNVRPGYARNFLIPRGIALESSSRNAKLLKHKLAIVNAKRAKLRSEAEVFGSTVSQLVLEFTLRIGAQGKSFGSITARDIEAGLRQREVAIDRRQIRLPEPIRGAGEHKVEIKLHSDVVVFLMVKVQAERVAVAQNLEGEPVRDRRSRKRSKKVDEDQQAESAPEGQSVQGAEEAQ